MIKINSEPLKLTVFPDKTSQVWKLPDDVMKSSVVDIVWIFESEAECMHVAQLKMLLDTYHINSNLHLPYLPYGRQDKEIHNNATFALRTLALLLNALNFQNIIITDPHSGVASELLKRVTTKYPVDRVHLVYSETESNVLCYPDKGALIKYVNIYKDIPYIYGEKVRDPLTGNILKYEVIGDPAKKNVLIVDDICDGGMTFKLLAKNLLDAGANKVTLFVTHGIFSKGIETLKESGINRIFTKDGEHK